MARLLSLEEEARSQAPPGAGHPDSVLVPPNSRDSDEMRTTSYNFGRSFEFVNES